MNGCSKIETKCIKTEFIYFGSRQQLTECQEKKTIKVVQEEIQLCNIVCYLGGYIYITLKLYRPCQSKVQSDKNQHYPNKEHKKVSNKRYNAHLCQITSHLSPRLQ